MKNQIILIFSLVIISVKCFAALPTGFSSENIQDYDTTGYKNYYVDPVNGSDLNEGSFEEPYFTIGYALKNCGTGKSVINLRAGNHGNITKIGLGRYLDWIVLKPYKEEQVIVERMEITGTSNIIIDGITFLIPKNSDYGFLTRSSSALQFRNLKFFGETKYTGGTAISITGGENYLIYNCEVEKMRRGFLLLGGVKNSSISYNRINNIASTAINYGQYNENIVIERNNISSAYSIKEESDMEGYTDSHGSGISLRDGNVLIKENIFRNLGASSGIMTYTDSTSTSVYSNIYIYNNLFYDILNPYIMRFYRAGDNIEIINNTLIGSLQDTKNNGVMKLGQTIFFHEVATGYTGEKIIIANNISAGWACAPNKATIKNNIFWSFSFIDSPFNFMDNLQENKILTDDSDYPIDYFTNNFFTEDIKFEFMHGEELNFKLSEHSPAKKFGDLYLQQKNSQGDIDHRGFIEKPLKIRGTVYNSIGCYEELAPPYGLKIKIID